MFLLRRCKSSKQRSFLSGQFGPAGFSIAAFFACFMATMLSILDSIGDYYACARVSRVPPPPVHAVNRGIVIEGLCSLLSGAVGCGHATTTFGGNIGAIGITKVLELKMSKNLRDVNVRWVEIILAIYIRRVVIGSVVNTVKPVLSGHSKIDKTKILMT